MNNIPSSSSSSGDDSLPDSSSNMSDRDSQPEVFTQTLKQQFETEDSITSLFAMHNLLTQSEDFRMYV